MNRFTKRNRGENFVVRQAMKQIRVLLFALYCL